jgi:peptidyl-prolyl cis-trans isomerase C
MGKVLSLYFLIMVVCLMVMVIPVQGEVKQTEAPDKVAIVNGTPITRGEFEGNVLMIQTKLLGLGNPLSCRQVTSIQNEVLESMVRVELLYQESRKSGIKPDEKAVEQEIKALKQQFASESEYTNDLKRRNISEEILRSRLEKNSSVQQYIERQFASKTAVTDNDMVSYYEGHVDLFKHPLEVSASHILVQLDPKSDASHKQEAHRKVEQILKDLKNGQDFAALARERSDGPTRTNGGDLGYIKSGQLNKQLESVVFSLKSGEISGIVETDYGYHLFKVVDIKPASILAYESVKERIRQYLMQEQARQAADVQAKKLREKAAVEILLNEEIKADK